MYRAVSEIAADYYKTFGEFPDKDPPIYKCAECGDGIYDGDDYYDIEQKHICVRCIDEKRSTAWR